MWKQICIPSIIQYLPAYDVSIYGLVLLAIVFASSIDIRCEVGFIGVNRYVQWVTNSPPFYIQLANGEHRFS